MSTVCPGWCCGCVNKLTVIDKIKRIKCKTLLIHGKSDSIVPFEHSLKIYSKLKNPYDPLWIDGFGHNNIPFGDVIPPRKKVKIIIL